MSLPHEILDATDRYADRTALVAPEVRWTYAELAERARHFGAGLRASTDLESGEAVMFQMGNVAETLVAYFGSLVAGLRPVCALAQHGAREIGSLAQHIGTRTTIVEADHGRGETLGAARDLLAAGALSTVVVARAEAICGGPALEQLVEDGSRSVTSWCCGRATERPISTARGTRRSAEQHCWSCSPVSPTRSRLMSECAPGWTFPSSRRT